ncbi:LysR family transcriptional regulator [Chromohalobacter sarecensis]|uniref:LysR family transcriptional regulator n=1 Tax=Chromohalobacter sarecensis TaxID=245294 RepID=A0ABV9D4N4_9GAMM|nr:LysR family transcriptional regulator [Chromohalobacter sarecensis]MCK0714058.1 LysR family transcriptional regulator [Chromohalobacter sarecensis]
MPDRLNDIDIGLLMAFEALIQERNVSRAADRLGISQPALSGRLTRLRALFGDQLFVPVAGRGVTPTPRAEALGETLPPLLGHLREFIGHSPHFDPSESDRTFVLAAYDNPAVMIGPDLVTALKRAAPHARITFVLPDPETITPALDRGDVDMVIGLPRTADEGLIGRTLFSDQFVTAQRRGHPRGSQPVTLDEFCAAEHVVVSSEGGGYAGPVDRALEALGRKRQVSLSVQSYALAPIIMADSDHLCTLPSRFLRRFESMLDLFTPPMEMDSFELYALWHPRMRDDPAHRWFRDLVVEVSEGMSDRSATRC